MKPIEFLGDTLTQLQQFPPGARRNAGFQLSRVQEGHDPDDWKPMPGVGPGVREIRVWDETGTFRVIYVACFDEAIFVLHAFQKKSEATRKRHLELASKRFAQLKRRMAANDP